MVVSEATLDDISALARAGSEFHEESPTYRHLPYDLVKVAAWAAMHINRDDMKVWIVRAKGGEIAAALFAELGDTFFGSATQVSENTFYVRAQYRGSKMATMLILEMIRWSRECGAARTLITTSSGLHHDLTVKFLARFGFDVCATGMVLENG